MPEKRGYGFGTFQGVFVPTILTILGVIMYLRFGWVLGNVGLPGTLLIVTIATSITFLTTLSLAELATNSAVGAGGAYYIISRSLGIEMGAAIGLPLFGAQALGIAFYISGFAESVTLVFPNTSIIMVSIITIIALVAVILISADLALKSQYLILALIIGSLVSFFAGSAPTGDQADAALKAVTPVSFWYAFSVFFPAVTGINSGLGMSGDLKNPARSLTWGTLAAVITGYIIYMTIPLFLNHFVDDPVQLIENPLIMRDVARVKWLIIAGIWGATLSSAMGALLSAPRTLQALANDKILPRIFGKGYGANNDPHIATLVTFGIAFVAVIMGDLNMIAPVLSMFFLTSYWLINLSATFEGVVGSPWWRPTFKVHWAFPFAGVIATGAVMLMIDAGATIIAFVLSGVVYVGTRRRKLKAHWGDVRTGVLMWVAQWVFYKLRGRKSDQRTWRPNLLVFTGSPTTRWYLVTVADALSRGRGLMTIVSIVPEDITGERSAKLANTVESYLIQKKMDSVVKVYPAPGFAEGASTLIRAYGFGPIVPNTVLLGAPPADTDLSAYRKVLETTAEMSRNVVIVGEGVGRSENALRIDVWWDPESRNSGLVLALAFLMCNSQEWQKAHFAIKAIIPDGDSAHIMENRIHQVVAKMRLRAKVEVFRETGTPHWEHIAESSKDAGFLFLGLQNMTEYESMDSYMIYFQSILDKVSKLPPFALVMSQESVEFDYMFFE